MFTGVVWANLWHGGAAAGVTGRGRGLVSRVRHLRGTDVDRRPHAGRGGPARPGRPVWSPRAAHPQVLVGTVATTECGRAGRVAWFGLHRDASDVVAMDRTRPRRAGQVFRSNVGSAAKAVFRPPWPNLPCRSSSNNRPALFQIGRTAALGGSRRSGSPLGWHQFD